jgi:methylmalonyl-CoA mutase N-terminal domain/subunit
LNEVRARRDEHAVRRALDSVRAAGAEETNTVESIVEATRARASIGEIVGELKAVWGVAANR